MIISIILYALFESSGTIVLKLSEILFKSSLVSYISESDKLFEGMKLNNLFTCSIHSSSLAQLK